MLYTGPSNLDLKQGYSHTKSAVRKTFCPYAQIWDRQLSTEDQDLAILSAPLILC